MEKKTSINSIDPNLWAGLLFDCHAAVCLPDEV